MQEGNIIPETKRLTIMGMPMDKSVLPEDTRRKLKNILYEDVLGADDISQVRILKSIAKLEKSIYESLQKGDKSYYKPVKIKSLTSYDNPMRIQGIKAALVYNALRDEGTEAIDLEKRNTIDIIRVNITSKNIDELKEKHPEKYAKVMEIFKQEEFSDGIDAIGLPLNVDVPEWLLDFIDYAEIINFNINTFPFGSLSFQTMNKPVSYSNIITIA